MKWLAIEFYPEGETDARFFENLIRRIINSIFSEYSIYDVEFPEEIKINYARSNEERARCICENAIYVDLFLIHADSTNSQLQNTTHNIINAIRDLSEKNCSMGSHRIIPLLTIQEMEAWALADKAAILAACGMSNWPARVTADWNERDVENIDDPKEILIKALNDLLNRRRNINSHSGFIETIGNNVSIDKLEPLPSFKRFKQALVDGFRELNLLN